MVEKENKRYPIPESRVYACLDAILHPLIDKRIPEIVADEIGKSVSTAERNLNALKEKKFIFISGPKNQRNYKLSPLGEKHYELLSGKHDKILSAIIPSVAQEQKTVQSASNPHFSQRPTTNAERIAETLSNLERIWIADNCRYLFPIHNKKLLSQLQLLWDNEQELNNWTLRTAHFKQFSLDKTTKSIRITLSGLEETDPAYLLVKLRSLARKCLNEVLEPIEKRLKESAMVGEPILEKGWHLETNDPNAKQFLDLFPGRTIISKIDEEKELAIQKDRSKYGHDLAIYSKGEEGVLEYIKDIDSQPIRLRKVHELLLEYRERQENLEQKVHEIQSMQKATLDLQIAHSEHELSKERKEEYNADNEIMYQ